MTQCKTRKEACWVITPAIITDYEFLFSFFDDHTTYYFEDCYNWGSSIKLQIMLWSRVLFTFRIFVMSNSPCWCIITRRKSLTMNHCLFTSSYLFYLLIFRRFIWWGIMDKNCDFVKFLIIRFFTSYQNWLPNPNNVFLIKSVSH